MGYALRLRWAWLSRTDLGRVWSALPSNSEAIVRARFDASVSVQVGNGACTLFWSWLDGEAILLIAPDLIQAVHKGFRKTRTVARAL
jgi:hypothetical protein